MKNEHEEGNMNASRGVGIDRSEGKTKVNACGALPGDVNISYESIERKPTGEPETCERKVALTSVQ